MGQSAILYSMQRIAPACVLAVAVAALGCGGAAAAPADASVDAVVDVLVDVPLGVETAALDSGAPEAALEAGFACALPPAAVDSRVDGGFGCTASPAYTVNGSDVCSSSQYAYGCYGATAPDSLQCQEFTVPNPPDTTFYCCPCVIPTCTQPLDAGCAQPNLAGCPRPSALPRPCASGTPPSRSRTARSTAGRTWPGAGTARRQLHVLLRAVHRRPDGGLLFAGPWRRRGHHLPRGPHGLHAADVVHHAHEVLRADRRRRSGKRQLMGDRRAAKSRARSRLITSAATLLVACNPQQGGSDGGGLSDASRDGSASADAQGASTASCTGGGGLSSVWPLGPVLVPASLQTDAQGNVYVAGSFQGSATIGGITLVASGPVDMFLAKLGPTGKVLSAARYGASGAYADPGAGHRSQCSWGRVPVRLLQPDHRLRWNHTAADCHHGRRLRREVRCERSGRVE